MPTLGQYAVAAQMRDLIARTVTQAVEMARPRYRYATVVTIDRTNRKCEVNYQGEPGNVWVNMGGIQPLTTGQVVRIDGVLGDRFVSDVMGQIVTDYPMSRTEAQILALADKYVGQHFFVSDWGTGTSAWWDGANLIDKPWNVAWGLVDEQEFTANSSGYTVTGNSDFSIAFTARADRTYAVSLETNYTLSAAAIWSVTLTDEGTECGRFFTINEGYALGDYAFGRVKWEPTDGAHTLRVRHTEVTGTATLTYNATATLLRRFYIEDIGPRHALRTDGYENE